MFLNETVNDNLMNRILLACKGVAVGLADLIPGISGGTVALLFGIYERLITAVKDLRFSWIWSIFLFLVTRKAWHLRRAKRTFLEIDWQFLIPLGIGVGFAVIVLSHFVEYFLHAHFDATMALFVGLILSSTLILLHRTGYQGRRPMVFGFMGGLLGIALLSFDTATTSPSILYLALCGFIAIMALFLPGISGSYILLLLGQYEHMLDAITNPFVGWPSLLAFIVGACVGAYVISHIIAYLLKNYHGITICALIGFLLGSLAVPVSRIGHFGVGTLMMFAIGFVVPFALFVVTNRLKNTRRRI